LFLFLQQNEGLTTTFTHPPSHLPIVLVPAVK
jgi:hypothetical protein